MVKNNKFSLKKSCVLTLCVLERAYSSSVGDVDFPIIANPFPRCGGTTESGACVSNLEDTGEDLGVTATEIDADPFITDDSISSRGKVKGEEKIKVHEERTSDSNWSKRRSDQCTLYLAESSIPNAGIGIYTSVDFKKGDRVGEGDILIPLTDFPPEEEEKWLIKDVKWGVIDDRLYYESNDHNSIFYPGFGAQINCHFGLENVLHGHPTFDSAGLHRSRDPGAGSFSNWHDMPNMAVRDISAGEELFASYGDDWFTYRDIDGVPSLDDFREADEIISNILGHSNVEQTEGSSVEDKTQAWNLLFSELNRTQLKRALPEKYEELEEAHNVGSARYSLGGKDSIRTQEWLNENGMCMDAMYVKTSEIPQAGRGSFIKGFASKGSILSPSPMLQISQHHLIISDTVNGTSGKQLLTNYAFGHPDSDILLVPYNTVVNFINHGGKHANAKLRWSESTAHRKDYLELKAEQLLKQKFGLLMEIVALRDILHDEEVLIDYGKEWEEAWEQHIEHWIPQEGSMNYTSAEAFMRQAPAEFLTEDEQKLQPYPRNIQTACYFWDRDDTMYQEIKEDEEPSEEENHVRVYWTEWHHRNNDCLRQCKILSRTSYEEETYYNVEILPQKMNLPYDCIHPDHEKLFVDNIPGDAVTLVDRKFTRDQHLSNAFRHHIGLPDELFPVKWKRSFSGEVKPSTS